jgi:hypothetical protein
MPRGLKARDRLSGFYEIFVSRPPEDKPARYAADGERNVEVVGYAGDPVLHGVGACPFREGHASGGVVQRLNFCLEGVVEVWVNAGASGYAAGLVEGDVFEGDAGVSLSHG